MTYSYCKVYLNGCKLEKTTKKPVFKGEAGDIVETVMFIPPDQFKNKNVAALVAAAKEWIAENT